jgi:hypothetical protein
VNTEKLFSFILYESLNSSLNTFRAMGHWNFYKITKFSSYKTKGKAGDYCLFRHAAK